MSLKKTIKEIELILNYKFTKKQNLIGKAQFIFFSLENSRFLQIWKWPNSIRTNRIFKKIK